jgi:hypothetical protein
MTEAVISGRFMRENSGQRESNPHGESAPPPCRFLVVLRCNRLFLVAELPTSPYNPRNSDGVPLQKKGFEVLVG